MQLSAVALVLAALSGAQALVIAPGAALRVQPVAARSDVAMFLGRSAPKAKTAAPAKKAPKKAAKKAATKAEAKAEKGNGFFGLVVSTATSAVDATPLGGNRLKGKNNFLEEASREKTTNPNLNIDGYQSWGPLGGVVEAVQLLADLRKDK